LIVNSFWVTTCSGWLSLTESISNVVSLNIENANTGQSIPATMHGIILETNLNRDDDGGLYAELVYNRAFQGRWFSYDIYSFNGVRSF
jgi:hypothetical protein